MRIGKYKIISKISSGGMGEVYLAKEKGTAGLERLVAFKMILPHFTEDAEFVSMFLEEAKLTAQLSHQNIVSIFEFDKFENTYYIAMEFVDGITLADLIKELVDSKQNIHISNCLFIIIQICIALDYAHRKKSLNGMPLNIVHRDVTPKNVMISFEGEVKLMDFGIAKATSREYKTRTGTIKGKIMYLSPEQIMGKSLDRRSDLFSLGTLFFELITGHKLFKGDSDFSIMSEIQRKDVKDEIIPNGKIPEDLKPILLKLLDKDREKRYQTAGDLQRDLEKFAQKNNLDLSHSHFSNFLKSLNLRERTERDWDVEPNVELGVSTEAFKKELGAISFDGKTVQQRSIKTKMKGKLKSRLLLFLGFIILNVCIVIFIGYFWFGLSFEGFTKSNSLNIQEGESITLARNIAPPKPVGIEKIDNSRALKKENSSKDSKVKKKEIATEILVSKKKAANSPLLQETATKTQPLIKITVTPSITPKPKPRFRYVKLDHSEKLMVYLSKEDIVKGKKPFGYTNQNLKFKFGKFDIYLFDKEPLIFEKLTIDVSEGDGSLSINVPDFKLGIITITTFPQNCLIKVDEINIGYPPINNMRINTGIHRFEIQCMTPGYDNKLYVRDMEITEGYNKGLQKKFEKI